MFCEKIVLVGIIFLLAEFFVTLVGVWKYIYVAFTIFIYKNRTTFLVQENTKLKL